MIVNQEWEEMVSKQESRKKDKRQFEKKKEKENRKREGGMHARFELCTYLNTATTRTTKDKKDSPCRVYL